MILKNDQIEDIRIDLDTIEKIEICTKEYKSDTLNVGNLGLFEESTNHNIALHFKKAQTIEKIYGFTEECDFLLFHMDNRQTFTDNLKAAVAKNHKIK